MGARSLHIGMDMGDKRLVLERLARGELSPEEAEELLDEGVVATHDRAPRLPIVAHCSGGGLIEVIGDPAIDAPMADGPCNVTISPSGDLVRVAAGGGAAGYALYVPADAPLDVEIHGRDGAITGMAAPFSATFNVGDARVGARLIDGVSTIFANCGDLHIGLHPASDVRVSVQTGADVEAAAEFDRVGRGEWHLGGGTAQLLVRGNLGRVELATAE